MDHENTTLRAVPKTTRGERRVTLILDAAATVLAEVGYDGATTNAIAQRAGTSIGSLYQFFPNKEALVQALAERYRTELKDVFDAAVTAVSEPETFPSLLDVLVDALVTFSAQNCAFEVLFCFAFGPLKTLVPSEALAAEMDARVDALFQMWAPHLAQAKRQIYARVCVTAAQSLLPQTHNGEQVISEMVIELKRLLYHYLEPIFSENK